jgi:DNA-binding sugar fermentation-stimulating protein
MLLLTLDNLIEGTVEKRPSKFIKTPYVADIIPIGSTTSILGHTASLGCCGLADVGASILMAPVVSTQKQKKSEEKREETQEKPEETEQTTQEKPEETEQKTQEKTQEKREEKRKCAYRVYLSVIKERGNEIIIGIHPKLAEDLTETALKNNLLSRLLNVQRYKRETTIFVEGKVDSRFDFSGIDCNGIPFLMEVKNVPLADYEDITAKDRKHKCYDDRAQNSKVAYFPDGYRKKSTATVSPRALKHLHELTLVKKESKTRCIMCYVIQRTDVESFQPSIIDPLYREAFKEAIAGGVEIITMVVQWKKNGESYFVRDDLPVNM